MKSANWLTNVILLILLIAISFLSYKTSQHKESENAVVALTPLVPEKVSRIQINKKNKHTVIQRQDGVWFITKPVNIKANQFRIGSLLRLLTTNNFTAYASEGLDLEKYGLFDSTLNVQVDDVNIIFGNTNPINQKRYILINDNMYLIEDNFYPLINSQLGTLVDQKLIADNKSEITGIKTTDFTLMRNKENRWGSTNDASSDDIIKTVTNWKNVQAFGVHDYVARDVHDKIEITFADDSMLTFIISDLQPWLIIARPELNLEYHFDNENIAKLLSTDHEENLIENAR